MEVLKKLISETRKDYKCYDELKRLYSNDEKFKKVVDDGVRIGSITGFSEDIWQKINAQNLNTVNNFEDVFVEGNNIGGCVVAARQLSFSFDTYYYLCGGYLPLLKGTKNCANGEHTWLFADNWIYDTTLMLVIKRDYAKIFGYIEENIYDPKCDLIYCAEKEYIRNRNFSVKQRVRKRNY